MMVEKSVTSAAQFLRTLGQKGVQQSERWASKDEAGGLTKERVSVMISSVRSAKPVPITTITEFFDNHGVLVEQAPPHWVLEACRKHPLHESRDVDTAEERGALVARAKRPLSKRAMQINAQNALTNDQNWVKGRVTTVVEEFHTKVKDDARLDPQQQRHLRLLFEPLRDLSYETYEVLAREYQAEVHKPFGERQAQMRDLKPVTKVQQTDSGSGRPSTSSRKHSQSPPARAKGSTDGAKEASTRRAGGSRPEAPTGSNGGQLTNNQRVQLLSIFQRYVHRVSGPERRELMRRSSWFRFLHHCGLLGKQGGVGLRQASQTFAAFSERNTRWPTLSFIAWSNAIHSLLKQPGFFRTDAEVRQHLFSDYLQKCEQRLANDMCAINAYKALLRRGNAFDIERTYTNEAEKQADNSAWQFALAEEQMAEPEVMQLLHECAEFFEAIYNHYAEGSRSGSKPQSPVENEEITIDDLAPPGTIQEVDHEAEEGQAKPSIEVRSTYSQRTASKDSKASSRSNGSVSSGPHEEEVMREVKKVTSLPPSNEAFAQAAAAMGRSVSTRTGPLVCGLMNPKRFQQFLRDMHIFPFFVQGHNLEQHLHISLDRGGAHAKEARMLEYQGFMECLCRIAFVYMGVYGNGVQQAASAMSKCMWLIALMCQRVRERGKHIGLPEDIIREAEAGVGEMMQKREYFEVDVAPLEDFILWRTMDADLSPDKPTVRFGGM
mmetsp:Transcript_41051/g.106153  ORF Transcript_41051/g.106153 Transcript_41051/m.106153 type:complete len:719 (-) Transcript_41051:97-2253(-)